MIGKVYLVGAGPGDPGLITVKGSNFLEEADVVVYDRLVNPSMIRGLKEDVKLIYVGKSSKVHTKTQDEINESQIKLRETRILPKSILNPNLHFTIWQNHVSFTVWDKGLHSIIITNKSIYNFMKMMFEIAWSQASDKISK